MLFGYSVKALQTNTNAHKEFYSTISMNNWTVKKVERNKSATASACFFVEF